MANRPWYYVRGHGNRENMDKLIASKREKDARHCEFKRQNSDYFDKWQRQNEWMGRRGSKKGSLTKSTGNLVNGDDGKSKGPSRSKVPYDLDYQPVAYGGKKKSEQIQSKRQLVQQEMKVLLERLSQAEKEGSKLEDEEKFFTKQIENLLLLRREMKDKQENWTIREKKTYYKRFAKDKMRQKAFLVCEQLNNYKIIVKLLSKSAATIFISEKEKDELLTVIASSLDIINMYLDVNYKRNCEMIPLFNEEAEKKLLSQEKLWERERSVWCNLVDRVMELFFTIYKCKLEDNLGSQETLRQKRVDLMNEMILFKEKLKDDSDLEMILKEDLNHFLTN